MARKKKVEVALEQLTAVATDFNSFMFEPGTGIDLDLDYDPLLAEVVESAGELEGSDKITADTAATLADLAIKHKAEVTSVEDEEAQTDLDNATAADLAFVQKTTDIPQLLNVAKAHKIAVPPPFRKDAKKLVDYLVKKLSNADPVKAGKDAKAKVEKKDKKDKKKPGVMEALREITCEDETISLEDLTKQIVAKGYSVTQRTVTSVLTDTQKIIVQLLANGRLKK